MSRQLALITGGTSGIGYGIAKALGSKFDLALAYGFADEKAKSAEIELSKECPDCRVKVFKQPLFQFDDAVQLVSRVENEFSSTISVLVNSAGQISDGLFLGSDFSAHEKIIQTHLLSTMALSHCVLKKMYKQKFGRIINLSSISARYAKRGQTSYAAAKSGIEGFTKTLALEVAHRGITVNAVAPGLIATPMTESLISKIDVKNKIPLGRAGLASEVGSLVSFLCSLEASYITGETLTIDGGRSLGDSIS